MSPDTAQDIEEERSEEEDDTLVNLVKTSIANRMRKRRSMAEIRTGLVKEFIVNIPDESYGKSIREVCKVVVRGKCVNLSPTIINRFLERGTDEGVDLEATDNEICRMITAGQVNEWPSRKHLATSKLTVKYAFLHKIGSANWVPTNHISTISIALGRIIHAIGTRVNYDFGRFIFEQTIRHASTNAVKLPIAFPSIICGIILSQQPGILRTSDIPSRRKIPLSIHYKLFKGSHVNDVMTSARRESSPKGSLIDQLKEICKELDNGIKVAKARKEALKVLICSLEREER
ncbi:uncharacterized protein LOC127081622 [Lathyrus oleraceus]|uniref:uncharacterized protein LOC127081622 n=1 Tax=Pisum sativum TaxID=3888 RepID=UPI0021CEFEB5|nr:uncharacterized protein LOC127081622 [Pisum sativum]